MIAFKKGAYSSQAQLVRKYQQPSSSTLYKTEQLKKKKKKNEMLGENNTQGHCLVCTLFERGKNIKL